MKKKILQTIRKHNMLNENMHIIIGLSGGPDSMCMFDVLCSMAEEWKLQLYPVHVNHRFRPGAAEEDQAWVENLCGERDWPCRSFVYDCSEIAEREGMTSEEAGRTVRYRSFRQVADEIAASGISRQNIAIAVGQNANDQCETLLFRLMRGTGVDGLAGIAYKRWDEDGNAVIRPLLDVSRSEIEEYCRIRSLNPRRDLTNEEPVYMRNRIRLQLIPAIQEEYNPNIIETINRLAAAAAQDADYISMQAEDAAKKAVCGQGDGYVEFSAEILETLHPAIRVRLYNKALEQIGLKENISAAHLDGVEAVLKSGRPSASWNLPEGYLAEKRYDRLRFSASVQAACTGRLRVRRSGEEAGPEAEAAAGIVTGTNRTLTAKFDLQKLQQVYGENAEQQICLRTREDGDFMVIRTGGGLHRKKLQDMLVDMKIPKNLRDRVLLAAIGREVLWILPGEEWKGRYSSAYQPEDSSSDSIIILEYLFQV